MSSSFTPAAATSAPPSSSSSFLQSLSNVGLGYAIAIALAVLVLLSSFLLSSYICFRRNPRNPNPNGVVVPRVIFVAESDDDEDVERGGGPRQSVIGLDLAAINLYPKFAYSKGGDKDKDSTCSICLSGYRDGEMLRMMPDCRHVFHMECVDAWLRLNASCPVCRTSPMPTPMSTPMPTPMSTPLSEVVPLSQFAADRRRR